MCLVRSSSYPAFDDHTIENKPEDSLLPALLLHPKQSIETFGYMLDQEGAEILTNALSGYATLRRFYDLRDEEVRSDAFISKKSGLRPKARRRAAAKALLACIASAADAISGGLFDSEAENVVEHDVLLALLSEATAFVKADDPPLNMQQLMLLLRSIEDLQTVHSKIRGQCEECFKACLNAKYDTGSDKLDPREMMKKSVSGATESSGFSLVGSEITESSSGNKSARPKADATKRGWDWRDNFKRGTTGDQVLEYLRKGIAEEIAMAWVDEM